MRAWEKLPPRMQNQEVKYYYGILYKKRHQIRIKRIFDLCLSVVMIIGLLPVFLVIAVMIKRDSKGPVFYRQVRITAYGRKFKIFKFRTMVDHADRVGSQVTVQGDARITKVGHLLRNVRLDELPQLFNVFLGDMSFVGTRPEVPKYVRCYDRKMLATLLLPAGITSRTSIEYKDEDRLLADAEDADKVYISQIMPAKMEYNLKELEKYSIFRDLETMVLTVIAVLK